MDSHGIEFVVRNLSAYADPVSRLIEPLMQRLAGPLMVEATRFTAEGDIVVVEAKILNSTIAGQAYPNHYCNLFRLEAGRIVEAIEYADTVMMETVLGVKPGSHPDHAAD